MKTSHSSATLWITFFGVVLLLTGIFAIGRTAANLYFFGSKYPQGGVLAINTSGQPLYYQRESDCNYPPAMPMYDQEGKIMPVSPQQDKIDTQNRENCLAGVKDVREQAKMNDIAIAILFTLLGSGILATRKFFFV